MECGSVDGEQILYVEFNHESDISRIEVCDIALEIADKIDTQNVDLSNVEDLYYISIYSETYGEASSEYADTGNVFIYDSVIVNLSPEDVAYFKSLVLE